jgi:methyl acetate hydrolase
MTKAIGGLAAAILADRGRLDLNMSLASSLARFAETFVLDGWHGHGLRLRAPCNAAKFRQLAAHTAGFAYRHWNVEMRRYRTTDLPAIASGIRAAQYYLLASNPFASWRYGIRPDRLGLVVEAVGGQTLASADPPLMAAFESFKCAIYR